MTKEQVAKAIREARIDGRLEELKEAFCLLYRYGVVSGKMMEFLMEKTEKKS